MKRSAQTVASVLENFETASKVMESISNGAADGNAMKEMEVIMDSVDYKANEFKETITEIAQSSISQDFLKSMLESGTEILNTIKEAAPELKIILDTFSNILGVATKVVDTIGLLPTLFTIGSFKNIGKLKQNTPSYAPLRLCA